MAKEMDPERLDEMIDHMVTEPEAEENLPTTDPFADMCAERDIYKDKWQRSVAELENYRKRSQREMQDERKYREIDLLGDLLPVLDNVARAIAAAEKKADADSLLQGFKLLSKQIEEVMSRHHCTKIKTKGEPFDPNFHQAIVHQPNADVPPDTVIDVGIEGYKLHDRVVRAAQVIVSKAVE
jgi:molecular chaperone GrpE